MPIDEVLPRALRRAAGNPPSDVGDWDTLRSRAVTRRRHKKLHVGAALATVAIVAAGLGVATRGSDDSHRVVATPPRSGEIVAEVSDHGVPTFVVLSATDGHVVRTLTSRPGLSYGAAMSVPASGGPIYATFSRPEGPGGCTNVGSLPAVGTIPRKGGTIDLLLGDSSNPVVSADGRWLAYEIDVTCFATPTLGLTNVVTGTNYRPFEGNTQAAVTPLAIAPDGSKLVFLAGAPGNHLEQRAAFVMNRLPFDQSPQRLTMPGPVEAAAYLPDGQLVLAYLLAGTHHIVTVDGSGAIVEQLFASTTGASVQLSADPSGRLLIVFDNGVVQVWAPGDAAPVTIVPDATTIDVRSATWLPAAT